jgi:four helix bundle protein
MWEMKENLIKIKSYQLAVDVVNLYKHLNKNPKEDILSKQFLKSGTSIGANVREGIDAQSKADFIHKFTIALKEASETVYWIDLLKDTNYLSDEEYKCIYDKANQVYRIIHSIVKSSRNNK